MTKEKTISISSIPAISAIYFSLLQCGYDYYSLGRSPEHSKIIQSFVGCQAPLKFFRDVKQHTCEVYPYWPRAAILETASFYIQPESPRFCEYDRFHERIMSAANIADHERGQALWDWIEDFPASLSTVQSSTTFKRYLEWENEWITTQNNEHASELCLIQKCLDICIRKYHSPVQDIKIVVNPIKCVYSADYYLNDNCFTFCSGVFSVDSIIHEFLHHVVHPVIVGCKDTVLAKKVIYPGIDKSYYLSGDEVGQLNAFEEYAVRTLTQDAVNMNYPDNLVLYLKQILLSLS